MNEATKALALQHAHKESPREACGLVVMVRGVETYFACRNLAVGTDNFALHPEDYARAEDAGDIVAVFHSHPNASAQPGQADKVACEQSGLPWFIASMPAGVWSTLNPSGYRAPLEGRQWGHGVLDCLSLIQDYYREVLGIHMPDFERHDQWWEHGGNLYMDNYKACGFEKLPADDLTILQRHDVILMQVHANVPNHGAIYIGNNLILHHLHRQLSCKTVYGGYWRKHTHSILRFTNADSETLRRISQAVWP